MRLWCAVLAGLLAVGFGAGAAAGIPLCDYSTPRSDLSDLSLSFAYDYHNDPYDIPEKDISAGSLDVAYSKLFDSTNVGYDFSVSHHMAVSIPDPPEYSITARGNLKRYVVQEDGEGLPFFGFAGVIGRSAAEFETIGLSMNLGVGYGRFTDVTPLAKAVQIDEMLVENGALNGHLDDASLVSLAHEIDTAEEYASTAELLREIEDDILGTSGQLPPSGLDALSLFHVEQIILDEEFNRFCGGEIKLGLEYELVDPNAGPNNLLATLGFNYAFTTTPEAQFLLQGGISGGYDVWRAYRIELAARFTQSITDRILVEVGYDYRRQRFADRSGNEGDPTWRHDITLQMNLVPAAGTWVALEARLCHQPFYVQWCADIALSIGVDLI
jgi:hypothetical protein